MFRFVSAPELLRACSQYRENRTLHLLPVYYIILPRLQCIRCYQFEPIWQILPGVVERPLAAQTLALPWFFSPDRHICPEPAEIACEHFCLHVLVEPVVLLFCREPFDFEHKVFHQLDDVDEIAKEAFEIRCSC